MESQLLQDTKVLVVDDERELRDLLQPMLVSYGADCATAANAAEGCAFIAAHAEVEVVITDLNMPGGSGVEVVRAAARASRDIAVLVVSAEDDPALAATLIDLGVYGYLTKPFRPHDIVISIRSALQRRSVRLETRHATQAREQDLQRETVHRLMAAAELRDEETGEHIGRMSEYAAVIARALGLPPGRVELVRQASPMHDIGKIGIPDSVLLKAGPLTLEERQTMQLHPEIGHQILANSDSELLRLGAVLALTHHERYDGTGYPHGLAGEDIPIEGRIAAIADVFDALTSDRVYRPALSIEQAIEIMRSERGYHFDPNIFDVFLGALDQILGVRNAHATSLSTLAA
jgi:putative two-component system response regulator